MSAGHLLHRARSARIAGAIGVVMLRNPFYSVLALVVHLISLAVLFLLLRAEFVAAAQVVVYAGAVMVLYVFVVAYVGGGEQLLRRARRSGCSARCSRWRSRSSCASRCSASALKGISSKGAPYVPGVRHPRVHRRRCC